MASLKRALISLLVSKRTHTIKKITAKKPKPHVMLDHCYEEFTQSSNLPNCLHFLSSLSVENSRLDFSLLNKNKMTCVIRFYTFRGKVTMIRNVTAMLVEKPMSACVLLISNFNFFRT